MCLHGIKDIKSRLVFLLRGFSSIVDRYVRETIFNAVETRRANCIKPNHLATSMLDPKSEGIDLNDDEEITAVDFIHEKAWQLNLDVMTDLANYRAREGLWGKSCVWSNFQNMNPLAW